MVNHMDLRDLDCFVAVAETGSIKAASVRLNRVQSGVSVRLKNLEETLGTSLFDRHGKGLAINAAGERFLDAARDLLNRAEQARRLATSDAPAGRLRLGSMECTAAAHLPTLLSRYHKKYPQVQLELVTMPSWGAVKAVELGELDAAFVSADAYSSALEYQTFYQEELVLISDNQQAPIHSPLDLDDQALLVFSRGCAYRARLEQWAQQSRHKPLRQLELGSYHALLSCAAAGTGVGIVPRSVLKVFPNKKLLTIHPLAAKIANDQTCLAWQPQRFSSNLGALIAMAKNIK